MRAFSSTFSVFQEKILNNELFQDLELNYYKTVGHLVPLSEANSWRSSLPRLEAAIRLANLPGDIWITIEEFIPYYSKRADVVLFGKDANGHPNIVLIELKAWSEATAQLNGNVKTWIGKGYSDEPHPSDQVRGYHDHFEDFYRALHSKNPIKLSSCTYCHNYSGSYPDNGLFHPQFLAQLEKSPTFAANDVRKFADYLKDRLSSGEGFNVIKDFDDGGIGPSKQLINHASEMIQRQNVFRLLDEQLATNNAIISTIKNATKLKQKNIILVSGGPGTGKSVIALNALGEILRKELKVYFVSGSGAFTNGIRKLLGPRLSGLIRFTDFFWNFEEDSVDVLIIDEGHRIRGKSQPRVPTALRPKIPQIEELLNSAKITILFIDDNQIISPNEVGGKNYIKKHAESINAIYSEFQLTSQFRCNGSDIYLSWVDDILELNDGSNNFNLNTPEEFDFKVLNSPHDLLKEVQDKNTARPNSSRLLAGWCWPWSKPNEDGTLVPDIIIDDFMFYWEAKNGSRPAKGIPEAKYWAIEPTGVNQAGTVYSVQGFETEHVGVIIGADLIWKNNTWVAYPGNNYSNDLRKKSSEIALPYIKRIYRTLLSRGMKSCSIYCVDSATNEFIKSRLNKTKK